MNAIRKLERNIIKKQGTTSTFKERWNTYRTTKYGEGNVPRNTMKKKQAHYDSSNQYFRAWDWQKNIINAYKESMKKEKEEKVAETVTE